MKLIVKFPTRQRPDKFLDTFRKYVAMATDAGTMFLVTIDDDDTATNNQEFLSDLHYEFNDLLVGGRLMVTIGPAMGKIHAMNRDISGYMDGIDPHDVILIAQDDMIPMVHGYDTVILRDMQRHYPDTDGVLWYNDSKQRSIATLVVMGRVYWMRTRYIYHPSYASFFCDNEYTDVAKRLRKIKYLQQRIIEHQHPAWEGKDVPYDELYKHNDGFWQQDEANYKLRKQMGFPSNYTEGAPLLSILIATIDGREQQFDRITSRLAQQLTDELKPLVQILYYKDKKEISIGLKRQSLLHKSRGKYVCFIDDDDMVPEYYLAELIAAAEQNPDCIGFEIECTFDGSTPKIAAASNRYSGWQDNVGKYFCVRTAYHKTPVRRDIALSIGFKDMRFGEDHDFSLRLKKSGKIRREVFINKIMYNYQYSGAVPHNEKYGITN